ncbi:hypothetical protein OF001_U240076 [Pseudomonas sp. OF001]|nr:hypothetical protein OF001_U240076 [Pseudomonas sp. OF001]
MVIEKKITEKCLEWCPSYVWRKRF